VDTIADGIAIKKPGQLTFPIVRRLVDKIITVDDEEIADAVLKLIEECKLIVEGSGAASLAAVMHRRARIKGKNIVLVLSGGNIDVNIISRIIEKGLFKAGRSMRLKVLLADKPGSLQRLTKIIADTRANIMYIEHDRIKSGVAIGQAEVELLLETRGIEHVKEIRRLLKRGQTPFILK
jgi:threonine dehydratase